MLLARRCWSSCWLAWTVWTLVRLRRLEARVARAWTALDTQLQRRAGLAEELARDYPAARRGGPGPATWPRSRPTPARPCDGDRELAENLLGRELRELPEDLAGVPAALRTDLAGTGDAGRAGPPLLQRRRPRHRGAARTAGCPGCCGCTPPGRCRATSTSTTGCDRVDRGADGAGQTGPLTGRRMGRSLTFRRLQRQHPVVTAPTAPRPPAPTASSAAWPSSSRAASSWTSSPRSRPRSPRTPAPSPSWPWSGCPADIRAQGGIARMSDPDMIEGIIGAVSIPVMAKARIGHFVEAQVLQALGVDYIDESEVLTPADEAHHIAKSEFTVPFVCGATDLGEALRRISEGAAMIRSKGEAGTGNVVEATRHMRVDPRRHQAPGHARRDRAVRRRQGAARADTSSWPRSPAWASCRSCCSPPAASPPRPTRR